MTRHDVAEAAARLDSSVKRISRLETLEFTTVAFPSGAGFTLICDIFLAAPAASVTLCPVPIPATFRHLWLVIAAGTTAVIANKMELNVNADFGAKYQYLAREELPFGVPVGATDTEAFGPGTIAHDSKWLIAHAAGFEPDPTPTTPISSQGACMVQFPDYSNTDMHKYMHWFNFANFDKTLITPFEPVVGQGGGKFGAFLPPVAITSITVTAGGAGTFATASQFSLYGF